MLVEIQIINASQDSRFGRYLTPHDTAAMSDMDRTGVSAGGRYAWRLSLCEWQQFRTSEASQYPQYTVHSTCHHKPKEAGVVGHRELE